MVRADRAKGPTTRNARRVIALTAALLTLGAADARAAITVANTNDTGVGSLRRAITDAAAGETITVPGGTYTLTSAELLIDKSLAIIGAGSSLTILRSGPAFRVVHATGGASSITLRDLTVRDGREIEFGGITKGAGVYNEGATLTLDRVLVTNNVASSDGTNVGGSGGIASGGGVSNEGGSLTVSGSSIVGNSASARGGPAVGNGTGGPGGIPRGGGLHSTGALTVIDSTISENALDAPSGRGSGSGGGGPGGIAEGSGAYISPGSRPVSVTATTFAANVSNTAGGPPGSPGGSTGSGGITKGAGLFVAATSGTIALTGVTVAGNAATTNTTGTVVGGGIFAQTANPAKIALTHVTLAGNAATGNAGAAGGNLRADVGVELRGTILASGVSVTGRENCASTGGPTSLGSNLEDRAPSQCGFGVNDRTGVNALLGPLQDNGGQTATLALLPGSPAVDAASGVACPAADQRGVPRPQGVACDIGAYESAPGAATTTAASEVTATSARINGSATNPDAAPGSFAMEYGTTTAYGRATAPQVTGERSGPAALSASVAGLAPATLYHVRAVATNAAGTSFGADQTFTTAAAPSPVSPLVPRPAAPRPGLSKLKLTPRTLRADPARGRKRGATLSYTATQKGITTLSVLRRSAGVRVGSRCAARRPKGSKGKARSCVRFVAVGAVTHADRAGANTFHFAGRVAGSALRPGRYRLSAVARNAAGLRSLARTADFRIVR